MGICTLAYAMGTLSPHFLPGTGRSNADHDAHPGLGPKGSRARGMIERWIHSLGSVPRRNLKSYPDRSNRKPLSQPSSFPTCSAARCPSCRMSVGASDSACHRMVADPGRTHSPILALSHRRDGTLLAANRYRKKLIGSYWRRAGLWGAAPRNQRTRRPLKPLVRTGPDGSGPTRPADWQGMGPRPALLPASNRFRLTGFYGSPKVPTQTIARPLRLSNR